MASSNNNHSGSPSNEMPVSDEQPARCTSSNPLKRPRNTFASASSPLRDSKRVRKHARSIATWDWEAIGVPRSNAAGPSSFEYAQELDNASGSQEAADGASGVAPLAADLMDVDPGPQPVGPPPAKPESPKAPSATEYQNASTKSTAPGNFFSGIGNSFGRPRSAPVIIEKKKKDNRKATPPEIQPQLYEKLGHYAPKRRNRQTHLLEEVSEMESRRSSSDSDTSLETSAASAYSHDGAQRSSF
ncbi:hypothetical protein PG995_016133 [Apiospora arundinis]